MDPTRREDINVVIVMKAMGAESDQEIIQLVGEEESLAMLLMPTIQVRGGVAGHAADAHHPGGNDASFSYAAIGNLSTCMYGAPTPPCLSLTGGWNEAPSPMTLFVPSLLPALLQDCKQKGIFTQGQALDSLGEWMDG